MRRPAVAVSLVLVSGLAVAAPVAPATAQSAGRCQDWTCEDSSTTVRPGSGGGRNHDIPGTGGRGYRSAFAPAGPETQAALEFLGMPNTSCWQAVADPSSPMTYYQAQLQAIANSSPAQPACPDLDAFQPGQLVRLWWEESAQPPLPTPAVEPGRGVTGLPVYLTIGGDRTPTLRLDSPVDGQVFEIQAEAEYWVYWDWEGDRRAVTGPLTRNGVRYEDRNRRDEITWTYRDSGEYVIRVEARWTGRIGGEPFAQTRLTDGTVTLPVRQVQAVRRS